MFGCFRYLLAWMVAANHLWWEAWFGYYAVFGFYALSGYLMTLVLNGRYPATRSGVARYFANRALRIYPAYLAVALLGVLVAAWAPALTRALNPALFVPADLQGWLHNLFIFGLSAEARPRLVPPAWSLHVELVFYVLMGLGLSRRRDGTLVWVAGSIAYTLYLLTTQAPFPERYLPVGAASLPFSLGALSFHLRDRLPTLDDARLGAVAIGVFALHAVLADRLWASAFDAGFYASLLCVLGVVACLSRVDAARVPERLRRLDRLLGDLAYPVFLGHWAIAVVVSAAFFDGAATRGPALFAVSAVGIHGLALAISFGLERPVGRLRDRLRTPSPQPR